MLLATHSIVAASAGEAVGNPVYAFLLGIVIHFVLDAIPHYDTTDDGMWTTRQYLLVAIDAIIGLLVLGFIFFGYSTHKAAFVCGAVGGILPDLLSSLPPVKAAIIKTSPGRAFQKFHESIQRIDVTPIPGVAVQLVLSIISIYLLFRYVV